MEEKKIIDAYKLDREVYREEYCVDPEICLGWYKINPDIYTILEDDNNNLVGYVNLMPISKDTYDLIRSGNFRESDLEVLKYTEGINYLYFSSIVIKPDQQNYKTFIKLYNKLVSKFIDMFERNIKIGSIIAYVVSDNGLRFCKLVGMKNIKDNLYEISLDSLNGITQKTSELVNIYRK